MNKADILPVNGRVLILVEQIEERATPAGLVLPKGMTENKAISAGEVFRSDNEQYPVGTHLLYILGAGIPATFNARFYKFLMPTDILAVLKNAEFDDTKKPAPDPRSTGYAPDTLEPKPAAPGVN